MNKNLEKENIIKKNVKRLIIYQHLGILMAFGDRCDGKQIRTLSNYRRVYPFVMKTRTESAIYADFELEVGKTLEYMDKVNSGLSEKKVKFFHIFLASLVRTVAMRPQLNRFVMGRRLFQRNKIQISMIVKKKIR